MLSPGRSFLLLLAGLAASVGVQAHQAPLCERPPGPVLESARKFHSGHYVAVGRAEAGNLRAAANTPGISGVQRRYRWAQLEPAEGKYDFSPIARDLQVMEAAGVQLVVLVEDKTFDGTMPTPSYLRDDDRTLRGPRGYIAARWDSTVTDRMVRLVTALGEQFDCNPNFEGVAFQETALSLDPPVLKAAGYTPEKYRDSLIRLMRAAAGAVPRSRVFWYMNFLPGNQGYLDDIAQALVGSGVVMGGPDVLPDNSALAQRVYPLYGRFNGRLKLFGSMQHDSYRHPRGTGALMGTRGGEDLWSMEDLFLFARDQLHVNYVFWEYRSRRSPPDSRDWIEARDVIVRHPELRNGRQVAQRDSDNNME